MAKQLQLRRGTTLQNNAFIGAVGEPTLDTETGMIHIHDDQTQGGKEFIDAVVAFQKPTAKNGYTWYRKYASGWVEQGGRTDGASDAQVTVTFPIPFANTPNVQLTRAFTTLDGTAAQNQTTGIGALTTTSFVCYNYAWSGSVKGIAWWQAKGMAA